jgi:6,7-dimethyl-8-ribityllumazine synthase
MQVNLSVDAAPRIDGARVVLLKSKWHSDLVESMAAKCRELLLAWGCSAVVEHTLPGSLEMPLAAQMVLKHSTGAVDAIVCLGIIVKGDTYHFEMISDEVIRGLGQVGLAFDRPIIVEVLPVYDIQHAKDRAGDNEFNKGIEAALAAAEMIAWRRQLTGAT